jgi:LysM repeat protein
LINRRLCLPLLLCGLLLTGCYRQADDSFEQVNSQSLQSIASPTAIATIAPTEIEAENSPTSPTSDPLITPSKTDSPEDIVPPTDSISVSPTLGIPPTNNVTIPTATPIALTPEAAPPQVDLPTVNPPTATATLDIIPPTSTNVADGPQADDECVHVVVAGDTLFRIAINNGVSVEAVQQLNSLESDGIQIGQLIRIPECVPGQADEPTVVPSEISTTSGIQVTPTSSVGGSTIATVEPVNNLPTAGQQIHVVVSGETLGGIANRYNTSIAAIIDLNGLSNPDALAVGDELLIPASN